MHLPSVLIASFVLTAAASNTKRGAHVSALEVRQVKDTKKGGASADKVSNDKVPGDKNGGEKKKTKGGAGGAVIAPVVTCAAGQQKSGSNCAPCSPSTYNPVAGGTCASYNYARFAGYDCGPGDAGGTFYGTTPTWTGSDTITNGAEIYYTADAQDEVTCENTCQSTFPNPNGVSGGFNGFVWVPFTASDAVATQAGNPYSAFTCWCKANIADASNQLVASSFRSCNLSGACSQYNGLITNAYSGSSGKTPVCEDVSYTSGGCLRSDGSACSSPY